MIAYRHPFTANSAYHQTLEQGRPLAWWTLLTLVPKRVRVLAQAQLVLFELVPTDIALVRVPNERRPLFGSEPLVDNAPIWMLAHSRPPKTERAGIAGMMQDPQRARMVKLAPGYITFVGSLINAPWELEPLVTKGSDRRNRRSGALECAKELANALLDARIGVEPYASLAVIDKTDRQSDLELPAACLVENAPAQPGSEHVQFGFAHRPLQSQEQTIVEVGGIVNTILVEDQGVSERTDL